MAENIKRYVGEDAFRQNIVKTKEADEKVLADAKAYAEGLGANYDAAGASATALNSAKEYTNEQIADVNENVEKKADKTALEAEVSRATAKENEIVASVEAVQADVDALGEFVGEFEEGTTATTVIEYINKKTEGIATDTALAELQSQLASAQTELNAVKADYLKAEDKEELQGKINAIEANIATIEATITALQNKDAELVAKDAELDSKITQEAETARAAEKANADAITALEKKHDEDKESLQEQISANAGAIELLTNGVDTEKVDGVNDLIKYVEEHGAEVTGMQEGIASNAKAIANETTRATAKENALETAVGTKASQADLDAEVSARTNADEALDERLKVVEGQLGDGEGSVADMIADEKQDAINTAAQDATTKANQALADAKAYTDKEVEEVEGRVDALEADAHTHPNKALLDTYDQTNANIKNAVDKAHEHPNKTELDKIADGDVAKWNAAEANAKAYADSLNTTMTSTVNALDSEFDAHVEASDAKFTTINGSIATINEKDSTQDAEIAELQSELASMVALTADEVTAMWA